MLTKKQMPVNSSCMHKKGVSEFIVNWNSLVTFVLLVCAIGSSYGQLTALMKLPATAAPGSTFVVKLSINRGPIDGFMKLAQPLPEGYSATELDSKNGDFRFENKEIKIIWLQAPNEKVYTVTYKIKVPPNASGSESFGGKIIYVTNSNERKAFDLTSKKINIVTISTVTADKTVLHPNSTNSAKNTIAKPNTEETKQADSTVTKAITSAKKPSQVPHTSPSSVMRKKKQYSFLRGGLETAITEGKKEQNFFSTTYRVQIGAFKKSPVFKDIPEYFTIQSNDLTKHFSGLFLTYEKASERKNRMIEKGFKDAFIVEFAPNSIFSNAYIYENWWQCIIVNH
jgi:hypothetical protein